MKKILITLTLLLSSCSLFQAPTPEVSLIDVTFDEISLLETNIKTKIRYENEQDKELNLRGSMHQLSLNGIDIGKGITDEPLTIPRLGSTTQTITFRMSNLTLLTKIQRLIESQEFAYKIRSKLYVGQGFSARTIHITNDGEISLASNSE